LFKHFISNQYSDIERLKEYLETIVNQRTVLNCPVPSCFYQQEFVRFYDNYKDDIVTVCKNNNYTDKRKNDIMKQKKVQFAYWYLCKELLEEMN